MSWFARSAPVFIGALTVLLYVESVQSPFGTTTGSPPSNQPGPDAGRQGLPSIRNGFDP
jgi:hypothetical protein